MAARVLLSDLARAMDQDRWSVVARLAEAGLDEAGEMGFGHAANCKLDLRLIEMNRDYSLDVPIA